MKEEFNEELIENNDLFEDESDSIQEEDIANYLDNYKPDKKRPSKKTIAAAFAIIVIIASVVILCI